MQKKITFYEEPTFIFAIVLLAFAVALTAQANFGVSMIVAPAYILSLKIDAISFGTAEYILQGLLFILFCILIKKVKLLYFFSFITAVFYGLVLDLLRFLIPFLNPNVISPESIDFVVRILYLASGIILTSLSIALLFKVYLYPQVYDFFVKKVSDKFGKKISSFKIVFDFSFLALSILMTLILFGEIRGIGIGTLVMTLINGFTIGIFTKLLDRWVVFKPIWVKFSNLFNELN